VELTGLDAAAPGDVADKGVRVILGLYAFDAHVWLHQLDCAVVLTQVLALPAPAKAALNMETMTTASILAEALSEAWTAAATGPHMFFLADPNHSTRRPAAQNTRSMCTLYSQDKSGSRGSSSPKLPLHWLPVIQPGAVGSLVGPRDTLGPIFARAEDRIVWIGFGSAAKTSQGAAEKKGKFKN
jgi:hypothetical protein